jgi:predicted enzyme related to lactoylglutathione lyase
MHKSRLSSFVIDCPGDLDAAARFWSAALGREAKPDKDDDPNYRELAHDSDEPILLVQKVEHEGRVHLDIEADDLDAEAARLEALGAKKIAFVKRWWVMEAPTGQRFCIINPQRGPLEKRANSWPDKK